MSDLIFIGKDVQSFEKSTRFNPYDRVVLNLDDNNYISSPSVSITNASVYNSYANGTYKFTFTPSQNKWKTPTDTYVTTSQLAQNYGLTTHYSDITSPKDGDVITVTKTTVNDASTVVAELARSGSTLTADCPLVKPSERQTVADNLLKRVYGFQYQPYAAKGAYMNPAAEIGDAITAYNVFAGLFEQETIFNRLMLSNIGSAISDEAEVEMQYESNTDRRYNRKLAETSAEFAILADRISSAVTSQEFQAALNTMANQIDAKVSETGGNMNSFAWSLDSNGFYLYANGAQVFKCDRSGITVVGDATITGEVYASNIRSDAVNGYGGSFSGAGIASGTIAPAQCTAGVVQSLGYADIFNAARYSTSTLEYFKAGQIVAGTSFYSSRFIVADTSGGTNEYYLNGHYHSFTVVGDKIVCGAPNNSTNIDGRSFNIADTQAYRDGVAAVSVASRAVLYCNATNYTDFDTGFDCDMSGSSYHYDRDGSTYGRIEIRNSSGTGLKKIRVKLPASAAGAIDHVTVEPQTDTTADLVFEDNYIYLKTKVKGYETSSSTTPSVTFNEVLCDIGVAYQLIKSTLGFDHASVLNTTGSGDDRYTNYDTSYNWGTRLYNPSLSSGGGSVYGRVGIYSANSLLSTLRFALSLSMQSASTASDPSDYYQSGGRWYLKVHVKNSSTEIYQGAVDVQQAVDYGAASAGGTEYNLYCISRTENSAGLVTCDFSISSYNGLPWQANRYYTFRY